MQVRPALCSFAARYSDAGAGVGQWRRGRVLVLFHGSCMRQHCVGGEKTRDHVRSSAVLVLTWHKQVFMADNSHVYEVLVEYKGTKASGAPMVAAAADWGSSNIFARSVPARAAACCSSIAAGSTQSPATN